MFVLKCHYCTPISFRMRAQTKRTDLTYKVYVREGKRKREWRQKEGNVTYYYCYASCCIFRTNSSLSPTHATIASDAGRERALCQAIRKQKNKHSSLQTDKWTNGEKNWNSLSPLQRMSNQIERWKIADMHAMNEWNSLECISSSSSSTFQLLHSITYSCSCTFNSIIRNGSIRVFIIVFDFDDHKLINQPSSSTQFKWLLHIDKIEVAFIHITQLNILIDALLGRRSAKPSREIDRNSLITTAQVKNAFKCSIFEIPLVTRNNHYFIDVKCIISHKRAE